MIRTSTPLQNQANNQKHMFSFIKRSMSSCAKSIKLYFVALCLFSFHIQAQNCDPSVPKYTVNLTGNPDSLWISPVTFRTGLCCSATGNDVCVQFTLTLDPGTEGIIFGVHSGAMPSGSLYYQLNCGPQTPVGTPICLYTPGPHIITFCKPGGNSNEFSIKALSKPEVSKDITLNDGCSGSISASGFNPASITWNSIYPGVKGQYNSYLSCPSGCSTTTVTGAADSPSYIDYEVCGLVATGCSTTPTCKTVRVYFNPTLAVNIQPTNPTVCFGQAGTTITANPTGGTPPYSYLWSNGQTTQSIFVGAGTYTVSVKDTSKCPPVSNTVTVTSFSSAITANAGPDQKICTNNTTVQLNGAITAASGGIWSGGGTFSPSSTALNATYIPSATEIQNGFAKLILTTTGNGTCPAAHDTMVITINRFSATITPNVTNVTCYNGSNGRVALSLTGGSAPFTFSWSNTTQTTQTIFGLTAGTYNVQITDNNGCFASASAQVTQPSQFSVSMTKGDITCYGANNGHANVAASGGTYPYSYSWSTGASTPTVSNLAPGSYSVRVQDKNECLEDLSIPIDQPQPLQTIASGGTIICPGESTVITASAIGGSGGNTYKWSHGLGNQSSHSVAPSVTTKYTVQATDQNGCVGIPSQVEVVINDINNTTLKISSSAAICEGESTTISASAVGSGTYSYFWNNNIPNGQGPHNVSPSQTTTYIVTIKDECNNVLSKDAVINVNDRPEVSLTEHEARGCDEVNVSFSNNFSNPAGTTYYWSFGDNTHSTSSAPMKVFEQSGVYPISVVVRSVEGCTSTASTIVTVDVRPSPVASFDTESETYSIFSPIVKFNDASIHGTNYTWSFGDGITSGEINPEHEYKEKGTYYVELFLTNEFGCESYYSKMIEILPEFAFYVPNAFTPNGDGKNDTFYGKGVEIAEYEMLIYNRWGELIYYTTEVDSGWNGKANNGERVAESDVYVYMFNIKDYKGQAYKYTGHVTLVK